MKNKFTIILVIQMVGKLGSYLHHYLISFISLRFNNILDGVYLIINSYVFNSYVYNAKGP